MGSRFSLNSLAKWIALTLAACLLAGCSSMAYYAQSIQGHLALMHAARPIDDWLADPATPAELRPRLELARRLRAFASSELALPDNASYHRYADLKRSAAVWSVAAAPPDSLVLKTWCFPFVGCVGYRGYYDEKAARELAGQLQQQEGLEVSVYGVPAYSTLGWLNWAGGDPLLSTFIRYPEGELARMIFHELAHQVVYVDDDTMFNESYATAVERLGVARWLDTQAGEAARRDYAAFNARRGAFRALTLQTREELEKAYKKPPVTDQGAGGELAAKKEAMGRFRDRYAALKQGWADAGAPFDGYDRWVAQANNATFGVQAVYDELVPGFEALFVRCNGDWLRFHAAVADLARQPRDDRRRQLKEIAG
ncbi:aminopeptidase [Ottowia thiooxydans]|uniref:aminopeptidase n=1 Tax=Ottowia thiooxydans TaxID=219182 RepID=UPI0005628756|nr:aminopeptidase [Ottowia thiooxydans]